MASHFGFLCNSRRDALGSHRQRHRPGLKPAVDTTNEGWGLCPATSEPLLRPPTPVHLGERRGRGDVFQPVRVEGNSRGDLGPDATDLARYDLAIPIARNPGSLRRL